MDILNKLNKEDIYTSTLAELSALIHGTRFENHVYLVGGAVRDILMDKPIHDIDLAVDLPNGGIDFATWAAQECDCYRKDANPVIYKRYGTAKFNIWSISKIANVDIECVQTRKESYDDENSRNPSTIHGTIFEDAERRDLTINALYLNISSGELLDPTEKGLEDLDNKVIRTAGDPNLVFKDDPLRMLRVIRFASKLGWGIDRYTWAGIVANAYRINIISQERINEEINKILLTRIPRIGFDRLMNCGLLKKIMPEVYALKGVTQGKEHFEDVYGHTMAVVSRVEPKIENRYAALFHDIAKPMCREVVSNGVHFHCHEHRGSILANEIMTRMKFSNSMKNAISLAIKYHTTFKQNTSCPSKKNIRKFLANTGDDYELALDLIHANNISHSARFSLPNQIPSIRKVIAKLLSEEESPSKIKLPISGSDIMSCFKLKQSPLIGNLLDSVKEKFLGNPKLSKDECLALCKEILAV